MKLKRILVRYYPPGILLQVRDREKVEQKEIDVFDLNESTDIESHAEKIIATQPILANHKSHLVTLLNKLLEKKKAGEQGFRLFKSINAHLLPLTNCAFNKSGNLCLTASYDRTAKVINVLNGKETASLEGHKNVVYAVAFNNPFGNLVVTGSFDHTSRVYDTATGKNLQTLAGHEQEVVCVAFDPEGRTVVSGSMDYTARHYCTETGKCLRPFLSHKGEVVSVDFDRNGSSLLTASFDRTSKIFDIRSGEVVHTFSGHRGEVSCAQFNFASDLVVTLLN